MTPKPHEKKLLLSLIGIFLIILLIFLIIHGYFDLQRNKKIYTSEVKDMISQRLSLLITNMNLFPQYSGEDVLFLSQLSSLKKVTITENEESKNLAIQDLEKDFLNFLKQSGGYYQLRYINLNGKEIVKVEFDGKNYKIIPKDKLQNKSKRYYFNETIKLNKGEVFVSPLDLNIKDEIIENRGTKENPLYVPVIRSATPIFDEKGNKKGIIILNIYADYFLDDVRNAQREGEIIVLINKAGDYMAHPNRSKEFSFMFENKNENFYIDYPQVNPEDLLNSANRKIESSNKIFSYRQIYLSLGTPLISPKQETQQYEENFWILVSITEKEEFQNILFTLKEEYTYFLFFSGTLILIIFILVLITIFKKSKTKERKK